ncbi:MAG: hypothetical protein JJ974_11050 [Phycisphaerales bacterium]|nr:hypothetical protein [Phycisphaerales bacterium]
MGFSQTSGLLLACCSGAVIAAQESPTRLEPSVGNLNHVAHIYYNIGTGEMITTLLGAGDAQQGVDGQGGTEIWLQDIGAMCADYGDTTSFYFQLNDPSDTTSLDDFLFDWGDIQMDTVVDCVQIHWVTDHQDQDLDGDQMADGVVGFAGYWIYWDAMNGRAPEFDCVAEPIIAFQFFNLPGELSDPLDQELAYYTADIDLAASFEVSMTFEIGDTDGDLQGADVHNSELDESFTGLPGVPDIDLDLNGLADWGWSVTFTQPGTEDVDNADGDFDPTTGIDGDPLAVETAGVIFGAPNPGHPEYDSVAGTWSWITDGPTAGLTEDAFNTATIINSNVVMEGPWFFGGLDCTPDESGYIPAAFFQTVLYGPTGFGCRHCPPDTNCDGVIDFFDLSYFLANQIDYNGDTEFDFFDISLFLTEYAAGCP